MSIARIVGSTVVLSLVAIGGDRVHTQQPPPLQFHLLEATIADVHRGIQQGQVSCRALVQAYINRARAYNGTCNQLVTEAMAPTFLPGYSEYAAAVASTASLPPGDPRKTPPIEFGRMETTSSDPTVQQQFGMTVGIPNAGQVRALGMINIRGERSVTCKGDFDRRPSVGPLPAGRRRCARSSAASRTRWSVRQSWTRSTAAIPTCRTCRCTASRSRSRIRTT